MLCDSEVVCLYSGLYSHCNREVTGQYNIIRLTGQCRSRTIHNNTICGPLVALKDYEVCYSPYATNKQFTLTDIPNVIPQH